MAGLQDKLKVPHEEGKKGSRVKITWDPPDQEAFEEIKKRLLSKLVLQSVDPNRPFVLRVDASTYAVGATLEQLLDEDRMPTPEDVRAKKRSRSLSCRENSRVAKGTGCRESSDHTRWSSRCRNGKVG